VRRPSTIEIDAVLADLLNAEVGHAGLAKVGSIDAGGDGVKDALVDAASHLLAERGARGWAVEDVAARAGVGRATVYRRFSSRDDLVRAAIGRDAHLFFAAVAASVEAVERLEDKVVAGFLAGLGLARASHLATLLRSDPPAALSLLTSEPLLRAATRALSDRYQTMTGARLRTAERAEVEAVAEALIRLGLSFILMPGPTTDAGDDRRARDHLGAMIRPILAGRT
jgi:AcrR family transcriptional regulator